MSAIPKQTPFPATDFGAPHPQRGARRKMSRFRCGLVEVEAFQWDGQLEQPEAPDWFTEAIADGRISISTNQALLYVEQNQRQVTLEPGDWLVREQTGEVLGCKAFLFRFAFKPL